MVVGRNGAGSTTNDTQFPADRPFLCGPALFQAVSSLVSRIAYLLPFGLVRGPIGGVVFASQSGLCSAPSRMAPVVAMTTEEDAQDLKRLRRTPPPNVDTAVASPLPTLEKTHTNKNVNSFDTVEKTPWRSNLRCVGWTGRALGGIRACRPPPCPTWRLRPRRRLGGDLCGSI